MSDDVTTRGELYRNGTVDLVVRAAERAGDALALRDRARSLTYTALVGEIRAAAGGLASLGVEPGDRVLVLARNSVDYAVSWLATQWLGAIHVPVNFMLSAREVAYVLEHSGATVALADDELISTIIGAARRAGSRATIARLRAGAADPIDGVVDFASTWGATNCPRADWSAEDIAQIAYTSGTESTPKGAMLSHRALVAEYISCILAGEYRSEDVVLHSLPLYHCAQMHCFLMPSLALGAGNVILSGAVPGEMIAAVAEHGITSMFAPPTVWIALLAHEDFTAQRLEALTKGYYGASIMPVSTVRELLERLPGIRLYNYYGQTELGPLATCLGPDEQLSKPGSAGRPVINVQTRVVDDAMRDVAPGEVGEVVHRSPQLTSGYYRDEARSAEAFAGGWFHSGDLATVDEDGCITIVDRKKDMINSGGENVSSREVEEVIYAHPDVSEVAVVGIPDPKWIEAVCAVVVRRPGSTVSGEELIAFVRERMAPFKVPKSTVFADELPKNPSGKILKRDLRDLLAREAEPGVPA